MAFDILSIVRLAGGLALFLYGMSTMGNGLEQAAGARLESTLEKMTGNILKALLMGAAVTAIIQSSSATTVMVVGFVNAGIMTLQQSVGVILGANVGTTITSQILRLDSGAALGSSRETSTVTTIGKMIFSVLETGRSWPIMILRSSGLVSAFMIGG